MVSSNGDALNACYGSEYYSHIAPVMKINSTKKHSLDSVTDRDVPFDVWFSTTTKVCSAVNENGQHENNKKI